jgi:hypothetical protein
MIRLSYLPANAAFAFTFGDSLIRMGTAPMFFASRNDAVYEARACGLSVTPAGAVYA